MSSTTYYERLLENIKRVNEFISLHRKAKDNIASSRVSDILRAAVVFLHAAEEDYLRGIICWRLIESKNPKAYEKIPLPDYDKDRFPLGSLVVYDEMTVRELIKKSVEKHMESVSFGGIDKIIGWLSRVDISLDDSVDRPQIEELAKRRHKIVHEVDLEESGARVRPLRPEMVEKWKKAVLGLVDCVEQQLSQESEGSNEA